VDVDVDVVVEVDATWTSYVVVDERKTSDVDVLRDRPASADPATSVS
jgi:hypothetical protein